MGSDSLPLILVGQREGGRGEGGRAKEVKKERGRRGRESGGETVGEMWRRYKVGRKRRGERKGKRKGKTNTEHIHSQPD